MGEAYYCDRCGGLFNGPPKTAITTHDGEFVLCGDCGEALAEWWELPETNEETKSSRPTSTVSRE